MSYWDRFILALYFGLAQPLPAGRDASLRILDWAISRGRLSFSSLNHTSLLLLLAMLPENSPHRPAVVSLAVSHGLGHNPIQFSQLVQTAAPPRLNEVVELYRNAAGPNLHDVALRGAALNALAAPNELGLFENLTLYLARRFLINPTNSDLRVLVTSLIAEATQR